MSDQQVGIDVKITAQEDALDRVATKLANVQAMAAQGVNLAISGGGSSSSWGSPGIYPPGGSIGATIALSMQASRASWERPRGADGRFMSGGFGGGGYGGGGGFGGPPSGPERDRMGDDGFNGPYSGWKFKDAIIGQNRAYAADRLQDRDESIYTNLQNKYARKEESEESYHAKAQDRDENTYTNLLNKYETKDEAERAFHSKRQDRDESLLDQDERQTAIRKEAAQAKQRAALEKMGVLNPGDYGYSVSPMTPGVSTYYAQQYADLYQRDPNTNIGFQTFMGQQSPMSASMAASLNTKTQAMSAAQVANINQTIAYNPSQMQGIQDWRQMYLNGNPGAQLSDWMDQAVQYRGVGPFASMNYRQIQGVGRMGIEAAHIYDQFTQLDNYETMNARPNIVGRAKVGGEMVGGALGAAAGYAFMGGPIGGYFGMTIGSTIGGAVASRFGTDEERKAQTTLALQNAGGLSASIHDRYAFTDSPYTVAGEPGRPGGTFNDRVSPGLAAAMRMREHVKNITTRTNQDLVDGSKKDFKVSEDEVAGAYGSLYEGMVGGGLNPDRFANRINADSARYRAGYDQYSNAMRHGVSARAFTDMGEGAKEMIRSRGEDQSLVDFVTTNISTRYGHAAPEIAKQVAPIFSSLPETGNNAADILMRYGPIAAGRYEESLTNPGEQPAIDMNAFRGVYNSYRKDERALKLAETQARGVGAATRDAYQNQMSDLAQLPDGRDSLAYKQLGMRRRGAELQTLEERDIDQYQIPLAKLSGEQQRNRILPFSPGSSYRNDLQVLQINQGRLGYYQNQFNRLKRSGDLSESEELRLTQTMEGIKTDTASRYADLAEGMIDRLPAMSAGRPSGFHSYDSMQLAQMQLAKVGHPSRYFGALNGQQAEFQDEFARGYAVPGTNRPYSRMGPLDGATTAGQVDRSSRTGPTTQGSTHNQVSRYVPETLDLKGKGGPAGPMPTVDQDTHSLLAQAVQLLRTIASSRGGQSVRPTQAAGNTTANLSSNTVASTNSSAGRHS